MNSKKKVMILSIIIVLITIVTGISLSYAYWSVTHVSNSVNELNSSCYNLEFNELNGDIILDRVGPRRSTIFSPISLIPFLSESFNGGSPSLGNDENVYVFTITNNCDVVSYYNINLETLEGSNLDKNYINLYYNYYFNLYDNKPSNMLELEDILDDYSQYERIDGINSDLLANYDEVNPSLDNAISSNNIFSHRISPHETHVYGISFGVASSIPLEEQEKVFNSKVTVNSYPVASGVKVSFDTLNDSILLRDKYVIPGESYGDLPVVSDDGNFVGYWYLDGDEKKIVNSGTIVNTNENHTLSAKWFNGTLLREDAFYDFPLDKSRIYKIEKYNGDFYSLGLDSLSYDSVSYSIKPNQCIELQENGATEVYAWLDGDTLYYYSDASNIYFNYHDGFGGYRRSNSFYNLYSIDLSSFRTSIMGDMSNMFSYNNNISSLNLSLFDTNNVTDMSHMFSAVGVTNLDLSNFDTTNVTDMSYMFDSCYELTNLDISNFSDKSLKSTKGMFAYDYNLNNVNFSSFSKNKVEYDEYMFCSTGISPLNVVGYTLDEVNTSCPPLN